MTKWENIYLSVNLKKVYQIQSHRDNELDECSLSGVVSYDSNENNDILQDFVHEDMNNCTWQREHIMVVLDLKMPQNVWQ
jgi:hypothetical protein